MVGAVAMVEGKGRWRRKGVEVSSRSACVSPLPVRYYSQRARALHTYCAQRIRARIIVRLGRRRPIKLRQHPIRKRLRALLQ